MVFGLSLVDVEVLRILAASDAPLTAAEVWERVERKFIIEPGETAARGCIDVLAVRGLVEHHVRFHAGKCTSRFSLTPSGRRMLGAR